MPVSPSLRFEVFRRDDWTCQYCGRQAPDVVLYLDHVIPIAQGGKDARHNLLTACEACNLGKGGRAVPVNYSGVPLSAREAAAFLLGHYMATNAPCDQATLDRRRDLAEASLVLLTRKAVRVDEDHLRVQAHRVLWKLPEVQRYGVAAAELQARVDGDQAEDVVVPRQAQTALT